MGGHKSDQSPAPNTYSLIERHNSRVRSAPKYSFGGRPNVGHFAEDLAKTPGPAVYNSIDPNVTKTQKPSYTMTGRSQLPGAHSPEKVYITRRQAPASSFGIKHSEYTTPII